MDVIGSEGMIIDIGLNKVTLPRCQNAAFEVTTKRCALRFEGRDIRAAQRTTVLPHTLMIVPVTFGDALPPDLDFAFDSSFDQRGVRGYNHITDAYFQSVHVRNDTDLPYVVDAFTRMGRLTE
jgi:hypothetical protein